VVRIDQQVPVERRLGVRIPFQAPSNTFDPQELAATTPEGDQETAGYPLVGLIVTAAVIDFSRLTLHAGPTGLFSIVDGIGTGVLPRDERVEYQGKKKQEKRPVDEHTHSLRIMILARA